MIENFRVKTFFLKFEGYGSVELVEMSTNMTLAMINHHLTLIFALLFSLFVINGSLSLPESLTTFNINKKGQNGEYLWSLDDIWRCNENKQREKKTKQVIIRCGCYDDGEKYIERWCITRNNYVQKRKFKHWESSTHSM